MVRRRIGLVVGMALLIGVAGWFVVNGLAQAAQPTDTVAKAPVVKEEAWQKEDPPGWDKWTDKHKDDWKASLERAKDALREDVKAREQAMLRGAEMAARKGVAVAAAESMAKMALDNGLAPADYDDLAVAAAASVKEGTKGRELTAAIQHEIERLKASHVKPAAARTEEKPAAPKPDAMTAKPAAPKPSTAE